MQKTSASWILAALIFIFLVKTLHMEMSKPTQNGNPYQHTRFSRSMTGHVYGGKPSWDTRNDPTSSLQLDEIDPRFDTDTRMVPTGPNPLHN
ncbi:hypothetical protein DCAR_0518968 [Daucus carota subsp. sativus]|uniref:Uncharacterized protein n=1 Tax=Daucus carota subsp. sativus TaxID=79200 RepID=A0AAF1B0W9_DAUCS|nr:hypothetical protein DCAR_0518968 [Daucus carota subsp. sativus]